MIAAINKHRYNNYYTALSAFFVLMFSKTAIIILLDQKGLDTLTCDDNLIPMRMLIKHLPGLIDTYYIKFLKYIQQVIQMLLNGHLTDLLAEVR